MERHSTSHPLNRRHARSPEEHDTGAPYSKKEAARIRRAVRTPGARVDCPRCGRELQTEGPIVRGKASIWWVYCADCRRNLTVRELPDDH